MVNHTYTFATIGEAWGEQDVNCMSTADKKARKKKKCQKGRHGKLENIMDVYTSSLYGGDVSKDDCDIGSISSTSNKFDMSDMYQPFGEDIIYECPKECGPNVCDTKEVTQQVVPRVCDADDDEDDNDCIDDYVVRERFEDQVVKQEVKETEPMKAIKAIKATSKTDVFYWEMIMYIVSGILLIFMMEQMVRIGTHMRM